MEAATALSERDEALAPILSDLTNDVTVLDSLELDSWERRQVERALSRQDDTPDWAGALAEAAALQIRLGGDMAGTDESSTTDSIDVNEESIRSVAIGLALANELQRTIDGLIVSGGMSDAKRLTEFRNRLSHRVGLLRDRLDGEQVTEAELRAAAMTRCQEDAEPLRPKLEEEEPERLGLNAQPIRSNSARLGRIVSVERKQRSLVMPLIGVLALLAVAWGVLILPRYFDQPMVALTFEQLPAHPAIRTIDARPPSLFVTVDGSSWTSLSLDERRRLIEEIGISSQQFDYTGAVVRDDSGRIVAEWLKHGGARLVKAPSKSTGS